MSRSSSRDSLKQTENKLHVFLDGPSGAALSTQQVGVRVDTANAGIVWPRNAVMDKSLTQCHAPPFPIRGLSAESMRR